MKLMHPIVVAGKNRMSNCASPRRSVRWGATGLTLLAAGAALALSACSRSAAGADAPTVEMPPAATYRAGHGLKLSPAGARFIELQTEEVRLREQGGGRAITAVPAHAVLRTIKGDFVFVANGERLLRTAVVLGPNDAGWVEIVDGLYEGDHVVVRGVDALWLAEIAAVNGGVGCADGH